MLPKNALSLAPTIENKTKALSFEITLSLSCGNDLPETAHYPCSYSLTPWWQESLISFETAKKEIYRCHF